MSGAGTRRDAKGQGAIRRFGRDRKGIAAVEFGMLALPFFMLIFAIFETSSVFLAELTLDQSVDSVARRIRTGELQAVGMNESDFRKEICKGVSFLLDCDKLKIDLKTYTDYSQLPPPSPVKNGVMDTSGFSYALAGSETITALRVFYSYPIYTDALRASLSNLNDGTHLLFSMAAFKTEPF